MLSQLYTSIISIYGMQFRELEYNDFIEDRDLLIIKLAVENLNTDMNTINKRCWPEILRLILLSKKYSLLRNDKLLTIIKKFDQLNSLNFNEILNPEEHIDLLSYLINSLFDTYKIRECIKYEIEKKSDLLRERACLELDM